MEMDLKFRLSQLYKQIKYQEDKLENIQKENLHNIQMYEKSQKVISAILNIVELTPKEIDLIQHELDHFDLPINAKKVNSHLKSKMKGYVNEIIDKKNQRIDHQKKIIERLKDPDRIAGEKNKTQIKVLLKELEVYRSQDLKIRISANEIREERVKTLTEE